MKRSQDLKVIANVAQAVYFALCVAILYYASGVLIPLALGILFAFLLSPVVDRLQRYGLSNIVSVSLTTLLVLMVLTSILTLTWSGISEMSSQLPNYQSEIRKKVGSVKAYVEEVSGRFSKLTGEVVAEEVTPNGSPSIPDESSKSGGGSDSTGSNSNTFSPDQIAEELPNSKDVDELGASPNRPIYIIEKPNQRLELQSWAGSVGAILGPLGTIGLVTVFALFALIYRDDLRDRFVSVISHGNYVVTTEALSEATERISRYLLAQLLLNVSYGVIFAIGLLVIENFVASDQGFPNVALLGTIAGLVRFIPYLGPLIGAAVPLLLSIAIFPGYSVVVSVTVLIVFMELMSNNVVEPLVYGSSTGVSAVAVIVSAVFWGTLWGPVGLLLATPMTVCLVVLGRYVPRFRIFTTLLGEDVQVEPAARVYQRLLSGDARKLIELLQSEFKGKAPPEAIDSIIVPTFKRILVDKEPYGLDDAELVSRLEQGINESQVLSSKETETRSTLQTEDSSPSIKVSATEIDAKVKCVGIASRLRAEAVILECLARVAAESIVVEIVDPEDLPDQEATRIAEIEPAFVLIAVLPPGGVRQALFWCKTLRRQGYRGTLLIACFGRFRNFDQLFIRFRKAGADALCTTVEQTLRRLTSWSKKTHPKSVIEPGRERFPAK